MAKQDDEGPRIQKTLNDRQVAERKGTLALLCIEKMKLDNQIDAKRAEIKPLTDQVSMLEEQIHTVTVEIDERVAWIPRQLALGEDPNAEPAPGESKPPKKKRASKRSANGAGDAEPVAPDAAE